MTERRVVITGRGAITPLGTGFADFWAALKEGKSGVGPITAFDPAGINCNIAAQVNDFEPEPWFKNPKEARRCDRYAQFGVAAAKQAWEESGLGSGSFDPEGVGVILGSGIGGLNTHEENHQILLEKGPRRVSPFTIPMMISNICAGIVSMEHGLHGPNFSISTACATANHCVGEAWRLIKWGDADAFIAGGAEATIYRLGTAAFDNMKAMSRRNDEPTKASRPWDRDRDGFVMGEGAGVVVVEELEHARRRGAHILAEIVGYGLSADAYHLSAPLPEGEGASRCMNMALRHAGLNPEQVQYVNAHGTSTPIGDVCETKAIKRTFGDYAKNGLLVSSTKSMTGHLLGAAGGVELLACVGAIQDGVIPPTINLDNPGEDCDLDYVPHTAREAKIDIALSNGFGFGGHNASLIVRRFVG